MFKINGLYFYLLSVYLFYQLTKLKQLYTRVMPVLAYVSNSWSNKTVCDVDIKLVVLSHCFVQPVMTVS